MGMRRAFTNTQHLLGQQTKQKRNLESYSKSAHLSDVVEGFKAGLRDNVLHVGTVMSYKKDGDGGVFIESRIPSIKDVGSVTFHIPQVTSSWMLSLLRYGNPIRFEQDGDLTHIKHDVRSIVGISVSSSDMGKRKGFEKIADQPDAWFAGDLGFAERAAKDGRGSYSCLPTSCFPA